MNFTDPKKLFIIIFIVIFCSFAKQTSAVQHDEGQDRIPQLRQMLEHSRQRVNEVSQRLNEARQRAYEETQRAEEVRQD